MGDIKKAVELLVTVFHKHSGKEGDASTLTKKEMKDLVQSEMGDLIGTCNDKAALDKIFKELDFNGDGVLDFIEYATLICTIATICHEGLCKH